MLDSVTFNPPLGAAPLSVTVQEEEPSAFKLPGVQKSPLSVRGAEFAGLRTVIVPPVPDAGTESPRASAATVPLFVTTLVRVLPAEIVKVAVATDPFAITVVFSPKTMHVVE